MIDFLPRASKLFRRDFKQPRRVRLRNKYLRADDYFLIITFCSHSISATNSAKNGVVAAP